MKNLLDSSVQPEIAPNILYTASKHWISFVLPVIFILLGIIGIVFTTFGMGMLRLIGFGLLYLLHRGVSTILTILNTKIYLTEGHLTISQGVLGKTITDVPIHKLEGIYLTQNLLGKILNFGSLFVSTGGVNQSYVIKNPIELRSKIIN